jgi:hypothetical protein
VENAEYECGDLGLPLGWVHQAGRVERGGSRSGSPSDQGQALKNNRGTVPLSGPQVKVNFFASIRGVGGSLGNKPPNRACQTNVVEMNFGRDFVETSSGFGLATAISSRPRCEWLSRLGSRTNRSGYLVHPSTPSLASGSDSNSSFE